MKFLAVIILLLSLLPVAVSADGHSVSSVIFETSLTCFNNDYSEESMSVKSEADMITVIAKSEADKGYCSHISIDPVTGKDQQVCFLF